MTVRYFIISYLCWSGWRTLPWVLVGSGVVVTVENTPSQSTLPYRPAYWLLLEYREQVIEDVETEADSGVVCGVWCTW